jgi:glyoxylase-like metal-dependent hydrolase (beta-lactamase superfamily II)
MILEVRAEPPFFKNGYVVGCEETNQAILIDPGDEVDQLLEAAQARQLVVRYILLTHAHLDHISGVARAKAVLGVPVGLHQEDNFLYEAVVEQGRAFGFPVQAQPPVDFFYEPEAKIDFGKYQVHVRHTPGHCPGGVCLATTREGSAQPALFVGDTLFAGSIGRTDLPGGDMRALLKSIREVLFAYPDDSVVYSGHGEPTTIGREKRTNPFLK